jgi:bacteriorhodopsin
MNDDDGAKVMVVAVFLTLLVHVFVFGLFPKDPPPYTYALVIDLVMITLYALMGVFL